MENHNIHKKRLLQGSKIKNINKIQPFPSSKQKSNPNRAYKMPKIHLPPINNRKNRLNRLETPIQTL